MIISFYLDLTNKQLPTWNNKNQKNEKCFKMDFLTFLRTRVYPALYLRLHSPPAYLPRSHCHSTTFLLAVLYMAFKPSGLVWTLREVKVKASVTSSGKHRPQSTWTQTDWITFTHLLNINVRRQMRRRGTEEEESRTVVDKSGLEPRVLVEAVGHDGNTTG